MNSPHPRRASRALRTGGLLAAGVLLLSSAGGGAVRSAPPPGVGIDPFDVLDLQVKPNILILLDTSSSMKFAARRIPGFQRSAVGGDDTMSRLAQAKTALADVVRTESARYNFGLYSFVSTNRDKPLARTQQFMGATSDAATTPNDGPFVYVSKDEAAELFYWRNADGDNTNYEEGAFTAGGNSKGDTFACPDGSNRAGYFCDMRNAVSDYNENPTGAVASPTNAQSEEIYRSFSNRGAFALPYPAAGTWDMSSTLTIPGASSASCPEGVASGDPRCSFRRPQCTAGSDCRYYIQSRVYRTGRRYVWDRGATNATQRLKRIDTITCPAPPAGLLLDNPDSSGTPRPVPCFEFENYKNNGVGDRATFFYTSAVFEEFGGPSSCGGTAPIVTFGDCNSDPRTQLLDALRPELPVNTNGTLPDLTANPSPASDLMTGAFNPAVPGGAPNPPGLGNAGLRADGSRPIGASLTSIRTAAPPFFPMPTAGQKNVVLLITDGEDSCGTTAAAADAARALYVNDNAPRNQARTMVIAVTRSQAHAAAADRIAKAGSGGTTNDGFNTVTCPSDPTVPCRGAFVASSAAEIKEAILAALSSISTTGEFSTTASVYGAVPEYVDTVPNPAPSASPFSPLNPANRYGARAFRAYRASFDATDFRGYVKAFDHNGAVTGWEAGEKLRARVDVTLSGTITGLTFSAIRTGNLIRRRIFTTTRNGVAPARAMLWRESGGPDSAVAPVTDAAGSLDDALFMKSDGTQMTVAELQAPPLNACLGANLPSGCTASQANTRLATTRREAREMILAATAGAVPLRDATGNPVRDLFGNILYKGSPWLLADSTLGTPALVTPPGSRAPKDNASEYTLMRDGPRDSTNAAVDALDAGFGLRHPDSDGKEEPVGALFRPNLKPVMSVLYVPTNGMLHAFRAGPQCPTVQANLSCLGTETGGEELWSYVPFDQLPKLRERLRPQTRTSHVYMLASSLRFGDVFVPGSHTVEGKSYSGKWRRLLLMGRGIGGKYYSALDVTAPGPFTRAALSANLPDVLWARGNPDRQDGTPSGQRNGDVDDLSAYQDMGQTWSTPALARVGGLATEYVAFVGSGYGTAANEGTRFYTLDVLTGAVLASADVGDASGAAFENAIVAPPAPYAPELFLAGTDLPHPAEPKTQAVYVGDIHGRMWKFKAHSTTALSTPILLKNVGVSQPIGVGAALLNLGAPHVFFVTGHDARVAAPVGGFQMWGVKDNNTTPAPAVAGFPQSFPAAPVGSGAWRGTLPPLTAFYGSKGVVFFVATRFNPATAQTCSSSFDTLIHAPFAADGSSVYDSYEYLGAKAVGVPAPPVRTASTTVAPVDHGTGLGNTSEPPPPPVPEPQVGTPLVVTTKTLRPSTSVCR